VPAVPEDSDDSVSDLVVEFVKHIANFHMISLCDNLLAHGSL